MNHHIYREFSALNQHYQQMLEVLQRLAELFPELKQDELLLYEFRLKKLQCDANVRILESLIDAELKECGQHQEEIARLEKEKRKERSIFRWMEGTKKEE